MEFFRFLFSLNHFKTHSLTTRFSDSLALFSTLFSPNATNLLKIFHLFLKQVDKVLKGTPHSLVIKDFIFNPFSTFRMAAAFLFFVNQVFSTHFNVPI